MTRSRSFMGWIALVSGAMLVTSAAGCDKKKEGDTSEKSEKSEKSGKTSKDGDEKKTKGDDEKYASGDVFKHVPKTCKYIRVYVNVGLFLKNEAIEKSAESLEEKLSTTMKKKDAKQAGKALKALKAAGIDPAKDLKEIAVCGNADEDDLTIALGGNFAGKDPLGAIIKGAEDDKDVEKKKADGVDYVKDGKAFIAAIAPNVLVVTKSKANFGDLKDTSGSASEWDAGKGRIVAFKVNDKKNGKFSGTISESGSDLQFSFVGDFAGDTGEKIEQEPKAFKKELEKQLEKVESKLSKGPFKKIADDLGAAKIKVDGTQVTVTLTVPASDLGDALTRVAEMDEDEMGKAVDL